MGIFDWFKRSPSNVTLHQDVIWLTKAAKLKGLAAAIADSRAQRYAPSAILLVAHFPECLEGLEKVGQLVRASAGICPVSVARAQALEDVASGLPTGDAQRLLLVVGERHPLAARDQAIVDFAGGLPCRTDLVHHVSLDDAVMRALGGEWVVNALKRLGMTEEESIESQMVSRRIADAQRKLARETIADRPADSAEAWMELNCPNVWFRARR